MSKSSHSQPHSSRLTRRQLLGMTGAGAASMTSAVWWTGVVSGCAITERPNILFLMADQHRGDCVGADGNQSILTPHLDRLAKQGAIFRRAYSSTPSCPPARTALMTGLAPWSHG